MVAEVNYENTLCYYCPISPGSARFGDNPDIANRPAVVVQSKDAASSQKIVVDWSPELEGLPHDMPLQQALARHDDVGANPG